MALLGKTESLPLFVGMRLVVNNETNIPQKL